LKKAVNMALTNSSANPLHACHPLALTIANMIHSMILSTLATIIFS
jgi:hypothetical protein